MVQVDSLRKPVVLSAVGRHVVYFYQLSLVFLRVLSTIAQPIGGGTVTPVFNKGV